MSVPSTLGPINATNLLLYFGGTVISHTTDYTLKLDGALVDATTRNSAGWSETIQGVRKWSLSVSGIVAYDDAVGFLSLLQGPINRGLYAVKFTTGLVGDVLLSGNVHVSTITQTAKMETVSTWTGTLEGTGPLLVATN